MNRETILLVEDNALVCELAFRVLRKQGYNVLRAKDGLEALQVASKCASHIDLLLTDVLMPRMNGKILADQLVGDQPDLEVLFMSGYTNDVIGPDVALLPKPFQSIDLTRMVRKVLDN